MPIYKLGNLTLMC